MDESRNVSERQIMSYLYKALYVFKEDTFAKLCDCRLFKFQWQTFKLVLLLGPGFFSISPESSNKEGFKKRKKKITISVETRELFDK